ncbi:ABC-type branched-subunit amino acid transport system ATPase component [Bradyrhizobium sp. F1.13.4]
MLGRNGAGKTTLMKTIVGELPAWKGEVAFDGRDISRRATQERVRAGIGYVPQEHSVFARLSVRDNLAVGSLARAGKPTRSTTC